MKQTIARAYLLLVLGGGVISLLITTAYMLYSIPEFRLLAGAVGLAAFVIFTLCWAVDAANLD